MRESDRPASPASALVAAAALLWSGAALAQAAAKPASPVEAAISAQVDRWNAGDLEGALQAYCPSARISWVNAAGLSHGYEPFADSMRDQFGSGAAMGRMEVETLETRDLGPAGTLAVVRWSIVRDDVRLMGGISTQLWAECEGRVRIVFEHAS